MECSNNDCKHPVAFVRCTQFAGDHPFCDVCARKEKDFDVKDITGGSYYWCVVEDY